MPLHSQVANKFNLEIDPRAPVCQWKFLRALGRHGELAGTVGRHGQEEEGAEQHWGRAGAVMWTF